MRQMSGGHSGDGDEQGQHGQHRRRAPHVVTDDGSKRSCCGRDEHSSAELKCTSSCGAGSDHESNEPRGQGGCAAIYLTVGQLPDGQRATHTYRCQESQTGVVVRVRLFTPVSGQDSVCECAHAHSMVREVDFTTIAMDLSMVMLCSWLSSVEAAHASSTMTVAKSLS